MDEYVSFIEFCLNLLKSSNYEILFYIILLVILIWLYKEFRKSHVEKNKANLERIDNAIEKYCKTLICLQRFIKGTIEYEETYEDIYMIFDYAPISLIDSINDFTLTYDKDKAQKLKEEIIKEIKRLKSYQCDNVSYVESNKTIELLSYYYKRNFESFASPLVPTFIAVAFISVSLLFIFTFNAANISGKLILFAVTISVFLNLMLIIFTMDVISEKKFNGTVFNKIAFGLLIFSLSFLYIPYRLIIAVIFVGYNIIYLIFIFKRTLNKNSQINK